MSLKAILDAQRAWANRRGKKLEGDYTLTLRDNLFRPLNPLTHAEFAMADGNELGLDGVRGKIRSLRSSSALAVNFFDYWRGGKIAVLGENGLGSPGGLSELRFERKSPLDFAGILQTSMSLPIPRKCPWPSNASLPNHTAAIRPTRR